jgi:hypothetical protein
MKGGFDYAGCTEAELWRHIAGHLEAAGFGVVLVGGAVVSVYSDGAYRSGDLDFVREELFGEDVGVCMEGLGFHRHGRHFEHPGCPHLFVEFVAGPLGIGADTNIVPSEEASGSQTLKILSPTDCVRDRLASCIHFRARECLDQAVLVAKAKTVDWDKIERWCAEEGPNGTAIFEEFRRRALGT